MAEFTKEFWDSKYPKIDKLYLGRQIARLYNIPVDVRCFITSDDLIIRLTLEGGVFGGRMEEILRLSEDEKVLGIQNWIIKRMRYVSEREGDEQNDFWQLPFETVARITGKSGGDCEDGASLICSMLLHVGFEKWRVRNTCGWVQASATAPQGGHSYCTLITQDNKVVPVDWCYLPQTQPLASRPAVKDLAFYKDVWFSFNNEFCWSHENIATFAGRVKK